MLWTVKGGRHGEYEQLMLDNNLVIYGWPDFPDLRQFDTKADIEAEYARRYPNASAARRANHVGQLHAFTQEMKAGHLVVVRLKTRGAIAVGEVTGPYEYREDLLGRHVHPVKWLQTDIPPDRFAQDLRFSFGSLQTVSRVRRNDAEARVRVIAQGNADPGLAPVAKGAAPKAEQGGEIDEAPDLAELARDSVRTYLARRFTGHDLARLVDAILRAQGYQTMVSPPGPDGGVDILAGAGAMGFGSPRLVVQVKSGDSMVGGGVLNELQGTMQKHSADQGLLVSWGGFKGPVHQEARRSFFRVRLWDQDELLSQLLEHYPRLDESIKVNLPLKQVWVFAGSEVEAGEPE